MGRNIPYSGSVFGRFRRAVRRASRYDLVLTLIPASFLIAAVLGMTLSVTATTAVTAAALVSSLAVIDALFLNPPRDPSRGNPPA